MSEGIEKLPGLLVQLSSRQLHDVEASDGASEVSSSDDDSTDTEDVMLSQQVKQPRLDLSMNDDEIEECDSGYTQPLTLHYPKSAKKLKKRLKSGKYDLFQRNKNGETPLHAIVGSGRSDKIECLLILMVHSKYGSHSIDTPLLGKRNGDTALHQAVQLEDIKTVKVLVAFGADVNLLNYYSKKTPMDILIERGKPTSNTKYNAMEDLLKSLGAKCGHELPVKRDSHDSADLPELHRKSPTFDELISSKEIAQKVEEHLTEQSIPISHHAFQVVLRLQQLEEGWKAMCSPAIQLAHGGSRVLCLDGGGMRGLIQIEILSELERRTGRKVTDLFDWIIGTSTGGIVALGLVYGKKSLAELRQVYFRLKEEVFAKSVLGFGYDTKALERILESIDCEMKMSAVKEPKVLISAVHKQTTNLKLTFFNNCFNDEYSDELVWKVARYTSAAPMYFSECDDYVDGGILANNPSEYGLTAIQNCYRREGVKLDIACVVSVGTGNFKAEDLGCTNAHEGTLNVVERTKKAINLMTLTKKALGESEDVAKNSQCRCEEQNIPFFRFSPNLDSEVKCDETNNDVLIDMLMATRHQIVNQWNDQYSDLVRVFSRIEKDNKHVKKREKENENENAKTCI